MQWCMPTTADTPYSCGYFPRVRGRNGVCTQKRSAQCIGQNARTMHPDVFHVWMVATLHGGVLGLIDVCCYLCFCLLCTLPLMHGLHTRGRDRLGNGPCHLTEARAAPHAGGVYTCSWARACACAHARAAAARVPCPSL